MVASVILTPAHTSGARTETNSVLVLRTGWVANLPGADGVCLTGAFAAGVTVAVGVPPPGWVPGVLVPDISSRASKRSKRRVRRPVRGETMVIVEQTC